MRPSWPPPWLASAAATSLAGTIGLATRCTGGGRGRDALGDASTGASKFLCIECTLSALAAARLPLPRDGAYVFDERFFSIRPCRLILVPLHVRSV